MYILYLGTDREAARKAFNADALKTNAEIVRITDAHTSEDLRAALEGGGLFAVSRAVILENICVNPDMLSILLESLPRLKSSADPYFIYEEKPLADLKKKLEKHAEDTKKFDAPKKERDTSIFEIANAMRKGDKKNLWVSYMKEIEKGGVPEAIHGVLFWAAKDMFQKSHGAELVRARKLVAELAELPHKARRRGEELEYALERFVLSGA